MSHEGNLRAECCRVAYPVVAGIPDLRTSHAAWVDLETDRRRAEALAAAVPADDVAESIRFVFRQRPEWNEAMVQRRTTRILEAAGRLREECEGWLAPLRTARGPVLDLGCGPGMLLAAVGPTQEVIGIDVSLEWLVVADRLARAAGVTPSLAAGHAESLPLPPGSLGAVAALDVLEHVGDQAATLREIDRVLAPGGVLVAATPNRFSLAAEPHVGIWGVGWLPRRWQAAYVHRRTRLPYAFVRLLSARQIDRLLVTASSLQGTPVPAPVPASDMARMTPRRRLLSRLYNSLLGLPGFRSLARHVGPSYHLVATKPPLNPPGADLPRSSSPE